MKLCRFKVNRYCGKNNCNANDCIRNGKLFCLSTTDTVGGERINGKDLIEEEVRSYYLFEAMTSINSIDKWFKYMIKFD